jgi:hypothetical protein
MRAEPRDFQFATPTGSAEEAAHPEAAADQPEIHVFAGDRIDAGKSGTSGWAGGQSLDFQYTGYPRGLGSGPMERLGSFSTRCVARLRSVRRQLQPLSLSPLASVGLARRSPVRIPKRD